MKTFAILLSMLCFSSIVFADEGKVISEKRARSLFILNCAGCHQIDGTGTPRYGVPSMHDTLGKFQSTPEGRAFLVQAPGARNSSVSNAELAAITNWELKQFSKATLPIDFVPYTVAEVSRWRANPPLDIANARSEIVRTWTQR